MNREMENIWEMIATHYKQDVSRKSSLQIVRLCEKKTFESGVIFINTGQKNNEEYFVVDGVVRSFLINQAGEAITLSFFETGSALSPHVTRTQNGISLLNFEAITSCRLICFAADKFEKLIEENLEIRDFANTLLRAELFRKIQKEIQLTSWTSRERLEQFRKDYHMLENRIPHPMIASYLGITNVSLSRLRKSG
jgi:CRP-like cAMP-binding protein